eukprot:TRINITY_DN817_c0_g1_i10.p1 TRINITY_DN817_c0_g1~~TRINITY_DN817_c0_g1_i10.p1  ORF type:complete len:327 (+),score=42.15 TRINITY_DN817_c0_g1_i10:312-1292(+)
MFEVHPAAWVKTIPGDERPEQPAAIGIVTLGAVVYGLLCERRRYPMTKMLECDMCPVRVPSSTAMMEHALWECPVARDVQGNVDWFIDIGDTSRWPQCTRLHGIVPRVAPPGRQLPTSGQLFNLQKYLACVVLRRLHVKTSLQPKRQRIYLEWEHVKSGIYYAPPTVQELKMTGSMKLTQRYAKYIIRWLRRLRWYDGTMPTSVTYIELAIDFEQATGLSLGGELLELERAQKKGRRMGHLLRTIQEQSKRNAGRPAIPAEHTKKVYTLRGIGAGISAGLNRRPLFASQATADSIIMLRSVLVETIAPPRTQPSEVQNPPRGSIER